MNKNLIAIMLLAAISAASCTPKEEKLKTGDLIFVGYPAGTLSGNRGMAGAISSATGDGELEFVHTAILEVTDSGEFVIDATIKYGIDRHPLDTMVRQFYLEDGTAPILVYMRLKDNDGVDGFVSKAKEFIGEEYDLYFLPDNGMHYCTELVYDSYIRDGKRIFSSAPMNFLDKDGNMPEYWEKLFDYLGQKVPQGQEGTNPQTMSTDPSLVIVK